MPGDENDWWFGAAGREQILKLEAAYACEVNVEDETIRLAGDGPLEEFLRRLEGFDADTVSS